MGDETLDRQPEPQEDVPPTGDAVVEPPTPPVVDLTDERPWAPAPPVVPLVPPTDDPLAAIREAIGHGAPVNQAGPVVAPSADQAADPARFLPPAAPGPVLAEPAAPEPAASESIIPEPVVPEPATPEPTLSQPTAPPTPWVPEGTVDLTEAPAVVVPVPPALGPMGDLYRVDETMTEPVPGTVEVDKPVTQPNETVIMPVESVLGDHRAARARALGEVDRGADVVVAPQQFAPPSVYRPWPSFVLFVFRIVIAAILGVRATQQMLNFTATKALWAGSILPDPEVVAMVQIIVEYVVAVMLLLGLASRVAGVLIVVLHVVILSFLVWGAANPFTRGVVGFAGEYEVMMTVIGLLFAGVGGGGAAVDGAVHRGRLERKNARINQDATV